MVPPDGIADWECVDALGIRVRAWQGVVIVEAPDDALADAFDRRHRQAFPSDRAIPDGGDPPEHVVAIAGSDESGKGERDRALAVVAVVVPLADEHELLAHGVRDSKLCTPAEIASLARWISCHCVHTVEVVERGRRADVLRSHGGNESRLLAAMHASALGRLHGTREYPLARVDRFAPNRPVAALLATSHRGVIVDECPRGERHVACAAASIVARSLALRGDL